MKYLLTLSLLLMFGCNGKPLSYEQYSEFEDKIATQYLEGSALEASQALWESISLLESLGVEEKNTLFSKWGYDLYLFQNYARLALIHEASGNDESAEIMMHRAIYHYTKSTDLSGSTGSQIHSVRERIKFTINALDLGNDIRWRKELNYPIPADTENRIRNYTEPDAGGSSRP